VSGPRWCLPVPDGAGGYQGSIEGRMELPGGLFVAVDDRATDDDYRLGADLARKRLPRCKRGSTNWHWYRAVIAEHERREQSARDLAEFVRRRRLKALPADGGEAL
jgi:hypothetical protein